jgi:Zn-dependent M16 (insulinase) family peptidase
LHEIIVNSRLDAQDVAITLLKSLIAGQEAAIVSNGSMIAGRRIGARYTPSGFVRELSSGYSSASVFEGILEMAQTNWPALLTRLERIMNAILSGNRNGIVVNLTGDAVVLATVEPVMQAFLETQLPPESGADPFPDFKIVDHPWAAPARTSMVSQYPQQNEAFVVPTDVNYVGSGGPLFPADSEVPGSTMVMAQYLETGYLYNQLRVQNGAYGAFANFERDTGLFKLITYRDPDFPETLDVYKHVSSSLATDLKAAGGNVPAGLVSAIIGTIGELDGSYPSPEDVGWESLRQWLRNEPPSIRQSWRQQILQTGASDFKDFTARVTNWQQKSIAAVVSQNSYNEAAAKGYNMTVVDVQVGNILPS